MIKKKSIKMNKQHNYVIAELAFNCLVGIFNWYVLTLLGHILHIVGNVYSKIAADMLPWERLVISTINFLMQLQLPILTIYYPIRYFAVQMFNHQWVRKIGNLHN